VQCRGTAFFAREVEDQDSGNLTRNHFWVEDRSTNHRYGLYIPQADRAMKSDLSKDANGGEPGTRDPSSRTTNDLKSRVRTVELWRAGLLPTQ
jgi:hypothetical protein